MEPLKLVTLVALFGLAFSQSCGGYIYDTSTWGYIYSPSNNGLYPPSADCSWYFYSYYGNGGVQFTFDNIYLEQYYDYIKIYENGVLTVQYTGNVTGTYTTSTSNVVLEFTSDSVVQFPAFYIVYQWVSGTCGGTIDSYYGTINPESASTGNYEANANCTWSFPTYQNYVSLSFQNLYLESGYDYIYIYTTSYYYGRYLYTSLTGSVGYYEIDVPTPATVVFVSDSSQQYPVWSCVYDYTNSPSDSDSDSWSGSDSDSWSWSSSDSWSWSNSDSWSWSGSGSSSSSNHHGRAIVSFLIIIAFLLGCVGGLIVGMCIITRYKARVQKEQQIPMTQFAYAPIPMYPPVAQIPPQPQQN